MGSTKTKSSGARAVGKPAEGDRGGAPVSDEELSAHCAKEFAEFASRDWDTRDASGWLWPDVELFGPSRGPVAPCRDEKKKRTTDEKRSVAMSAGWEADRAFALEEDRVKVVERLDRLREAARGLVTLAEELEERWWDGDGDVGAVGEVYLPDIRALLDRMPAELVELDAPPWRYDEPNARLVIAANARAGSLARSTVAVEGELSSKQLAVVSLLCGNRPSYWKTKDVDDIIAAEADAMRKAAKRLPRPAGSTTAGEEERPPARFTTGQTGTGRSVR